MAEADKAAERSNLILQLGRLLAAIHDLTEKRTPPESAEYQVAAAQFKRDFDRWRVEAQRFIVVGEVTFGHELDDITGGFEILFEALITLARDVMVEPRTKQVQLAITLKQCEAHALAAIDRVPIEWVPRLLEEQTPFSAYLKIRDAIVTAKRRIHYFDRYLDAEFYPLYLRNIDRTLEIRLVTTKGNIDNYGVENIKEISRRVAQEFANYQLIECDPSDMHDRNLRIDDMIFLLGTSAKDAGKYPTNFSPSDSTPNGHNMLDGILAKGKTVT